MTTATVEQAPSPSSVGQREEYLDALEVVNKALKDEGITPMEVMGTMGADVSHGYVNSNENNPKLAGKAKYNTYNNILVNTSIVGAGVRYFLNMLGNAKWNVVPADESDAAQKHADWLRDVMDDMKRPWSNVVRKGAMYRFYGFSIQEWITKDRPDGTKGFFDIAPRPQSTIEKWHQDPNGYFDGVSQRDPVTSELHRLDMWKMVYMVDDTLTDSPEGLGIFRHLVKPAEMLTRYLALEGYGFESDLRGIPIIKAPLGQLDMMVDRGLITTKQKDAVLAPMRKFINNHIKSPDLGVLMDSAPYRDTDAKQSPSMMSQWDIKLLTSDSNSQNEIAAAIERITHEVARALGVQQLLLGSGKVGTQALSKDNSKNFLLIVASSLKELQAYYQTQLWDVLWEMNGFPQSMKPSVEPEEIQLNEVESITKALKDMGAAGVTIAPDDPVINEVRNLLGLIKATPVDLETHLKLAGKDKPEPLGGKPATGTNNSGKTESEKD